MKLKNILIVGGTSGIGRALCDLYSAQGCKVAVTGRNIDKLTDLARGGIITYKSDVWDLNAAEIINRADEDLGGIDIIIISSGIGYINAELNTAPEIDTVKTNVMGFTDWATCGYRYFEKHLSANGGEGRLAAISSIASFRGSDLAPAYYASKAYVSNYMEGLRKKAVKNKLNLKVCTIIPGFVDTALAQGVGGNDGIFWLAPVKKSAKQILSALAKGKKIAYITKRWRLIAWVLKIVPDFIYNKV